MSTLTHALRGVFVAPALALPLVGLASSVGAEVTDDHVGQVAQSAKTPADHIAARIAVWVIGARELDRAVGWRRWSIDISMAGDDVPPAHSRANVAREVMACISTPHCWRAF